MWVFILNSIFECLFDSSRSRRRRSARADRGHARRAAEVQLLSEDPHHGAADAVHGIRAGRREAAASAVSLAGASRGGAAELLRIQPLPPAAARGHLHRPEPGGGSGGAGLGGAGPRAAAPAQAWLKRNQPLLRIFLSYCSLHGSHGGGPGLRPHGAHSAAAGVPAGNTLELGRMLCRFGLNHLNRILKGSPCFTHPEGILGLYDFLLSDKSNQSYIKNYPCSSKR